MKRRAFAQVVGCNPETIRYYENIGLLSDIKRDKNGYRSYTEQDKQRLLFILKCRKLGFSIEDISDLLSLTNQAFNTCQQAKDIAQNNLSQVRSKIAELQVIENTLSNMTQKCQPEKEEHCALLEELIQNDDKVIKIY